MYGQNYDLVIFGDSTNNYDFNNIRQQVHSESKGMYLVKLKDDRSPFDWKRMEELVDLGVSTTDVKERLRILYGTLGSRNEIRDHSSVAA